MKQATIIFHANCPDGFTAGWLIKRYLERTGRDRITMWEGRYGEPPPPVHGGDVFLVDFCYEPEHLVTISNQSETLTILDHHETALGWVVDFCDEWVIDDWDPDYAQTLGIVVLDQNHSGAMLASLWTGDEHYFVNYVEDRDLWRFQYGDETRNAFAMITSFDYTGENWDHLASLSQYDLLHGGESINRYRDLLIQQTLKDAYQEYLLNYPDIWQVPCPYAYGSDVAGELAKRDPERFAAYYMDKPDKKRRWGLRSAATGLNVAELAATVGGGGHAHASGYETRRL